MENSQPFYTSKTFWTSAIVAIVPLIPWGIGSVVSAWIAANPELFSAGVGALFTALRTMPGGHVAIK